MRVHKHSALVVAMHVEARFRGGARDQAASDRGERSEGARERAFELSGGENRILRVRWSGEEVDEGGVEGRHDLVIVGESDHMGSIWWRWHNCLARRVVQ